MNKVQIIVNRAQITVNKTLCSVLCALFIVCGIGIANAANVVARPTAVSRAPSARASAVARTLPAPAPTVNAPESVAIAPVIENKSSQFSVGNVGTTNDTALSSAFAAARAAADASSISGIRNQESGISTGTNTCNTLLRECMSSLCANDFSKCAGDTDTTFGRKLDGCRDKSDCSGAEYTAFAREILDDRNHNAQNATFDNTLACGTKYQKCITDICGLDFSDCLGTTASNNAISKCKSTADECRQYDTGLGARMTSVFGSLRVNAEIQIARDEARLYELRDLMRKSCDTLGAVFDDRTLDCVFTVNFWTGNNLDAPTASKKLYAGSSFVCNQEWFGVDVTTHIENAGRLTREQTAASSSFLGSGAGVAAGMLSSGMIDRAIDSHKAERALDAAQDEHEQNFGDGGNNGGTNDSGGDNQSRTQTPSALPQTPQEKAAASRQNTTNLVERGGMDNNALMDRTFGTNNTTGNVGAGTNRAGNSSGAADASSPGRVSAITSTIPWK